MWSNVVPVTDAGFMRCSRDGLPSHESHGISQPCLRVCNIPFGSFLLTQIVLDLDQIPTKEFPETDDLIDVDG
ncbi:MAG: hypothetical protein U9M95_03965 [Candidatus Altiarchaeota archaeon]|nr:hypothetical protein [Candidatus Altiarchaeota archaeon]